MTEATPAGIGGQNSRNFLSLEREKEPPQINRREGNGSAREMECVGVVLNKQITSCPAPSSQTNMEKTLREQHITHTERDIHTLIELAALFL